ncbi:hypothetical protein DRQ32_07040, partial [bacterium]
LGSDISTFANASVGSGLSVPESSAPYASLAIDYYKDGAEDLLVSFSDRAASLNRNLDGQQVEAPVFDDRAPSDLHNGPVVNTRGISAADFNGDSYLDLFIAGNTANLLLAGDGADFAETDPGEPYDQSALLGSAGSLLATGASWGDAGGDHFLDLYIMSRDAVLGDVLLQSNGGQGFSDVTSAADLDVGLTKSRSAVWADMNLDGLTDLFVGWGDAVGPTNEWSHYYLNQGEDPSGQVTFVDVAGATSGPRIDKIGHVQSVRMSDVNGDNQLDLVIASNDPAATNNLFVGTNDGAGAFVDDALSLGLATSTPLFDVDVVDLNGNAVPDIIGVPDGAGDVVVFSGYGDDSNRAFRDATFEAGLGSASAFGMTVADFNNDTDPDVFLLRPISGSADEDKNFLWANSTMDGGSTPATQEFLTVELMPWAPAGHPNAFGVGATVSVNVTLPSGEVLRNTRLVDAGSGRASQGSRKMVFGLAGQESAEVTVTWPSGQSQVLNASSSTTGYPDLQIMDITSPYLISGSINATYIPSSGFTTHTYTWQTNYESLNSVREVLLEVGSKAPPVCTTPLGGNSSVLLGPSTPGVTISRVEDPGGNGWLHTLNWNTYCTGLCTYKYQVQHTVGGQLYASAWNTFFVGACADYTQ